MVNQMVKEKIEQAVKILNEKNIDMWMTYVRETGNMKDPMMDMIVGTGATWQSAFIITKNGNTHAVVGSLELANMQSVGTYKNIHPYLKFIKDDLIKVLDIYKPKKIAINYSRNSTLADGLPHGLFLELQDLVKDTQYTNSFVSSEEIVAALKGRKSASELDKMKEAIKETLKIFGEVSNFLKVGVTEKQVAAFVLDIVKQRGFETAWDIEHCPAVFTGPDTAGAHSGPTDRAVQYGHVVNMDFGVKVNGYCADLQRTWYICHPHEDKAPMEVQRGFDVIVESISKAAAELKPGKHGWEIDKVAREYIQIKGYDEYPHGLGHQVGRFAHDGGCLLGPKWERYNNLPYLQVEEGNIFTLEPRLTVKDFGIATVEEEVLVTKDGCEFLSERQKELYLIK